MDGCSRLGVLLRIVIPLSAPALATLGIVIFLWTWNDFLWPLIVITSTDQSTVQLGLASFQGAHQTNWSLLMAGNMMALALVQAAPDVTIALAQASSSPRCGRSRRLEHPVLRPAATDSVESTI